MISDGNIPSALAILGSVWLTSACIVDVIGLARSVNNKTDSHLSRIGSTERQPSRREKRRHRETEDTMAAISPLTDDTFLQKYNYVNNRHSLYRQKQDARISQGGWSASLPTELVFAIFKYLPQADLATACLVCRACMCLFNVADDRGHSCF